MKISFKNILSVFVTAAKKWFDKDPFRESAVIAYYAIFSLPGLLVVIITLSGYFFGHEVVKDSLASQISVNMSEDTAKLVQSMVEAANESGNSVWATIIGIATILVGATGVFAQFQKSLNIIWEVKADESKSGIWELVKVRLFSFGLIIAIAFILMISLVISAALVALGNWLSRHFSEAFITIMEAVNVLMSQIIIAILFALMFKIFPDAKIKWRHVWVGAIVTALLFDLGKYGLSLYFGTANPATGYGPAGSIILILLWVSYSSMIVFYGAEFTRAYAELRDGDIPPDEHAVKKKGRKA